MPPTNAAVHPLVELRAITGLSLRRCGAISGIDYRRWHLFEHGLLPHERELPLVAAVLRVEPDQLREMLGVKSDVVDAR